MKPTVTVVMACPHCATDLEVVNATVSTPSAGVAVVRCLSCRRSYDVSVFLRPSAALEPSSRRRAVSV